MSKKHIAKYIARSSAVASRMLGGEMMIMSVVDSTFFTLNPIATLIWPGADGRTPLSELVVQHICHEFDVGFEIAYRDVEQLIEQLSGHGILLVSEVRSPRSPVWGNDVETRYLWHIFLNAIDMQFSTQDFYLADLAHFAQAFSYENDRDLRTATFPLRMADREAMQCELLFVMILVYEQQRYRSTWFRTS